MRTDQRARSWGLQHLDMGMNSSKRDGKESAILENLFQGRGSISFAQMQMMTEEINLSSSEQLKI